MRVVIYARFSTDEQDTSSITDQISYCKDYLRTIGQDDAIVIIFSDEAISGELRNRPGVDHIWRGISKPEWDLLICEDCSRLFRNESACIELVETAYDNGMRTIFINDDVDTQKDGWEERLRDAAKDHERANYYLRRRICRKILGLWRKGAAIVMLRPGYKRHASVPASMGEPAQGPFFDEIDSVLAGMVREAFERIANDDPPWLVGRWLTEMKLPKCCNSTNEIWTDTEVINLIRQTIYRGLDRHRLKIAKKRKRSGKTIMQWNPEECWQREVEHLRIVSDHLWFQANAAIDERKRRKTVARGQDHRLYGIPRDSRGPLSNDIFVCGICEYKMHIDGRNEGGYRCGQARGSICWNKTTALRDFTHQALDKAIGEVQMSHSATIEPMVAYIQNLCASDDYLRKHIVELESDERSQAQQQSRLLRLARSTDNPPEAIVDDLERIGQRIAEITAELEHLKYQSMSRRPEVTRERIVEALRAHSSRLVSMSREAGVTLKQLIPDGIRAVPYLQFDTNKVVLRAEFTLQLANFLPHDLRMALDVAQPCNVRWFEPISLTVDLFKPSILPANGIQALALRDTNPDRPMPYHQIAAALGIDKRQAQLSVLYGRKMRDAGIVDPYIRLTEKPDNPSRWRTHQKFKTDGLRQAG